MPTTFTPQAFVDKWRDATLKERAADWPAALTDEEILACLLALSLDHTKKTP